jgi:hypothetical protein
MSILAVNKVFFLKAMAGLNNSMGEVGNNVAHKDRSDLDN